MRFFHGWNLASLAAWVVVLSTLIISNRVAGQPVAVRAGRATLLIDAFNALMDHQGRWAYTETRTDLIDGKAHAESVFSVDPSKPYSKQRLPIKIKGKPPTEKQLKDAADRGERAAKQRLDHVEDESEVPLPKEIHADHRADEVQLKVGGQKVTPQLDQAKVVTEDETSVTYEVPMHPEGQGDATKLLDKFELTARINRNSRQFERATIRQRSSLRVKLIAKVSDTVMEFEFGTPDPRYPSVPTKFTADGHISILFGKTHTMHSEFIRSDLHHITPYDERFGVKLGPTRTLEL